MPEIQGTTFSGGAVDISQWDTSKLLGIPGFSGLRKQQNALRQIQIAECASVWANFLNQRVHPFLMMECLHPTNDWAFGKLQSMAPHVFTEAMTRSDFLNLTSYVIDRMMLEELQHIPNTWQEFCKVNRNIRDFRAVERWVRDGGYAPFQKVEELEGFNRRSFRTGKYSYQVYKYEGGEQISWEAVINDDMDMFRFCPQNLAVGGMRTVEQSVLGLVAQANGPNAALYGTAIALPVDAKGVSMGTVNNVINVGGVANPPLTALNVIGALGQFWNLMTSEGVPISPGTDEIVIAVADGILFQQLQNIINTQQIVSQLASLGGKPSATAGAYPDVQVQMRNWISGRIRPVYAPELRNIMTSNSATSWWMFARPGIGRACIEVGFLQGYDTVQLYKKLPNTVRVSGGDVPEMGDFETMGTEYKGLIVFGDTTIDPRMTMASNGTSS